MTIHRQLPNFGSRTLLPAMKESLQTQGFTGNHVLIRSVQADRADIALQTGTDRDSQSYIFDIPTADSDAKTRAEFGVPAEAVTYLHDVDLSGPTPTVCNLEQPVSFSSHLDEIDQAGLNWDSAYLVYDPAGLKAAPNSLVEYWFQENPKDALLAVFTHDPKPPEPRTSLAEELRALLDEPISQAS